MSDDPYTDPTTGVLKNLLGITDAATLARVEQGATHIRLAQLRIEPIKGAFDLAHLQAMHRHIFQDVYAWAGEIRTVGIAKGQTQFAHPDHITREASKLFKQLASENHLKQMFSDPFVRRAAHYLTEINALHVFREGNGRVQRAFLEQLGREAGKPLDFSQISRDANILASSLAHHSGSAHMEPLIKSALKAAERSMGRDR